MSHAFAAALSPTARRQREDLAARAARFWADAPAVLTAEGGEGLGRRLRQVDPRLTLARVAGKLRIRAMELAAWPMAELLADSAPLDFPASAGLPSGDHEQALKVALARTGVSLRDARVRVGVTRGHLLAVVVEIPLDVDATSDQLQLAAETYVEVCLGDDQSDSWVVSIDVLRSPRQKSMLRVADPYRSTETHPLEEMPNLIARASRAIREQCPHSWIGQDPPLWTALEIAAAGDGPQADRQHASTCCPEALKAALEGLPFDSRRFTQSPEMFVWVMFAAERAGRPAIRMKAEEFLSGAGGMPCRLAGTGFGEVCDYVDLWVPSAPEPIAQLVAALADNIGLPVTIGFYDTRLSEQHVLFTGRD